MSRPKILVTNDDGYRSHGIIALATALAQIGDVTVVAPSDDCSGVGHSISVRHPVRVSAVRDRIVPTYRAAGTPADCVVLGAFDLCGGMPALVVSGINRGANLGDDVNYSGTVAAAIEGTLVGVPSIAISLATNWFGKERTQQYWESAAGVARQVASEVLATPLPRHVFLNVNVPNVKPDALRGTRRTRQGRKAYEDRLDRRSDPRGETYYWIWGSHDERHIEPGTDLAAVRDGYVSVTPMSIDRTDLPSVETSG